VVELCHFVIYMTEYIELLSRIQLKQISLVSEFCSRIGPKMIGFLTLDEG
jgi:hypothetical protein